MRRYRPEFTEADHESARAEGFYDANHRDDFVKKEKLAAQGDADRRLSGKLNFQMDLESEGVPAEELGRLSEDTISLPSLSPPEPEPEHMPTSPAFLKARVTGITNYLLRLEEKRERLGLSWDMDPENLRPRLRERFISMCHERQGLLERLEAHGEDAEAIGTRVASGEASHVDYISAEIEPEDSEVARIDKAYREDCRRAGVSVDDEDEVEDGTLRLRCRKPKRSSGIEDSALNRSAAEQHTGRTSDGYVGHARTRAIAPGPVKHANETKKALNRERLGQLDDQLDNLGYTRDTDPADLPRRAQRVLLRIIRERDEIASDTDDGAMDDEDMDRRIKEDDPDYDPDEFCEEMNRDEDDLPAAPEEDVSSDTGAGSSDGAASAAGPASSADPVSWIDLWAEHGADMFSGDPALWDFSQDATGRKDW